MWLSRRNRTVQIPTAYINVSRPECHISCRRVYLDIHFTPLLAFNVEPMLEKFEFTMYSKYVRNCA
jgi:hypothetical protein